MFSRGVDFNDEKFSEEEKVTYGPSRFWNPRFLERRVCLYSYCGATNIVSILFAFKPEAHLHCSNHPTAIAETLSSLKAVSSQLHSPTV